LPDSSWRPISLKKSAYSSKFSSISYKDGLWSVDGIITPEAVKNDMEVSIASDVYQGTYQYDELVDMQFVENAQKQN